jgi:hypothetical protein
MARENSRVHEKAGETKNPVKSFWVSQREKIVSQPNPVLDARCTFGQSLPDRSVGDTNGAACLFVLVLEKPIPVPHGTCAMNSLQAPSDAGSFQAAARVPMPSRINPAHAPGRFWPKVHRGADAAPSKLSGDKEGELFHNPGPFSMHDAQCTESP